ncbi:MAG: DUF2470 domain-containing protein [Actinomycetota bacterium]|nr:DUF2470 domain-containing protein [Actinomycetota bacterium]MDP2289465.1 DUF2470 domain-containing protein [Actinomycetota bacterium]
MSDGWITDDVVAAVCAHMNQDHAAETLAMAQAVADNIVSAHCSGLDAHSLRISAVTGDDINVSLRIAWIRPLAARADIRLQVVELYHDLAHPSTGEHINQGEAH